MFSNLSKRNSMIWVTINLSSVNAFKLTNLNSFPNNSLDSSKPKESADDNFSFDENGRKFSILVENIVGKREIAHDEQFLLFPLCFQKTYTADT